jgi:predicted O-methyltransferase YrrM
VAHANFARAGLAAMIDLRLGKALDVLPKLAAENREPFDLVFIDADKESIPDYFTWSLKLAHPGSMIIVDNVIRDGEIINGKSRSPSVKGVRRFNEMLKREKRVSATAIQTVGIKGYDGFTLALVLD